MADQALTNQQYLRKINLIVTARFTGPQLPGQSLIDNAIDLSQLRIKFSCKRSDIETPNTADIRVYNVEDSTAKQIKALVNAGKVILQAGYESNYGVIFQGNIKQVIIGRESATDTFVDIIAGDGDRAYNFAIVNTTLAAGSKPMDQVDAVASSMAPKGVETGYISSLPTDELPRGKVMYGNARDYARNIAQTTNTGWSIQNEALSFVPNKSFAPGEIVVLTSGTGMVGAPQQTTSGVNVKCLLNPLMAPRQRLKIDNASIQRQKLNLDQIAAAKGDVSQINNLLPRDLNADGVYLIISMEQTGDTRGVDWYTSLVCIDIDVSANPLDSVGTP